MESRLSGRDGMACCCPLPSQPLAPQAPAHLAELDLHEDLVLPPAAPLHAPGVLGPVGARAARRGAPGACEANSCPGKRDRGQAEQGNILPHPLLSEQALQPVWETLSWEVDGRTETRKVRTVQDYQLLTVRAGAPPRPPLLGWVNPIVTAATCSLSFLPVTGVGAKVSTPIEMPDKGDLTQHHTGAGHWEVGRRPQQVGAAQRP